MITMRVVMVAALLTVGATTALSAGTADTWRGREVTIDGIVHVKNPGVGVEPSLTVETQELWSVGEETNGMVFGDIGGAVRDRQGNTYLLDVQLSQIHVVGPKGGNARTIGGSGEGPAEFYASSGMVLLSDSVLCVSQLMPPRLVELTVSGRANGDYALPKDLVSAYINGCAAVDGGLILFLGQMTQSETSVGLRSYFQRIDANGTLAATYWEKFQKADFANITFDEKTDASPVWAVSADGRVFVNDDWDAYAIDVSGPSSGERSVFEREYQPLARPAWQMTFVETKLGKQEMAPGTVISETARTVVRIFPRPDGRIWVLTGRGENDVAKGVFAVFEEFDRSGRFVRDVIVQGHYQPGRDALYLDGDHVIIVVNGGELGGADVFDANDRAASDEIAVRCLALLAD